MTDHLSGFRAFYARFVMSRAGVTNLRLERAFATVARESFAGARPWLVPTRTGYVAAPEEDAAFLYQDVVIALDAAQGIHSGKPSLHAQLLAKLAVQRGETVIHVGAGTGYYSAILAELTGPTGKVHAYEIDAGLAGRARENLRPYPHVDLVAGSGDIPDLPDADAIYVNAAVTQPSRFWLDVLKPRGRLIFPLQGTENAGGMLLVTRPLSGEAWPAAFIGRAGIMPCTGSYDAARAALLSDAFFRGGAQKVRVMRFDAVVPERCWFSAPDWWLST